MRTTILLAALLLSVPLVASPAAAPQVTVVVRMKAQADLRRFHAVPRESRRTGVVKALRALAGTGQVGIRAQLRQRQAAGQVTRVLPLWVVNGLSVTATPEVIQALAARPDVAEIVPDEIPVVPAALPAEANVAAIGVPELWSLGYQGQGVVIATLDSGVDLGHPDLASRYRGGTNSWFDPYGQHSTPYDRTGHGTWTAGVLVGGDAGGTSIGVAPGATLIAARIWNDAGSATATAIHQAFQWVLDPDGDPATDDAPDVVNNSWSYGAPGCNLAFQPDLQALRSAGIVPVFAAGNYGPGSRTSTSPANYPEALSVGSVNDLGAIAATSSRGPSACGGATFPTVVAPGVSVWTTDLFSSYFSVSGTSIAAPHVAGLLAILLGAYPGVSGAQAEAAIVQTARDLGAAGPDDDFGNGIVDALAAYEALASAPPPPPTATADAFTVPGDVATTIADPGVLANDQDPGGLPLSAILAAAPAHGVLDLRATGGFTYTPDAGFSGTDTFGYKASNGTQESAIATVTLTVLADRAHRGGGELFTRREHHPDRGRSRGPRQRLRPGRQAALGRPPRRPAERDGGPPGERWVHLHAPDQLLRGRRLHLPGEQRGIDQRAGDGLADGHLRQPAAGGPERRRDDDAWCRGEHRGPGERQRRGRDAGGEHAHHRDLPEERLGGEEGQRHRDLHAEAHVPGHGLLRLQGEGRQRCDLQRRHRDGAGEVVEKRSHLPLLLALGLLACTCGPAPQAERQSGEPVSPPRVEAPRVPSVRGRVALPNRSGDGAIPPVEIKVVPESAMIGFVATRLQAAHAALARTAEARERATREARAALAENDRADQELKKTVAKDLRARLEIAVRKPADPAEVQARHADLLARKQESYRKAVAAGKRSLERERAATALESEARRFREARYFTEGLPPPIRATRTDSLGRFSTEVPPGRYALVGLPEAAPGGSSAGWLLWIEVRDGAPEPILLDDHNQHGTDCDACVVTVKELR